MDKEVNRSFLKQRTHTMTDFDKLEVEDARELLLRQTVPVARHETIPLAAAGGRIAYTDVRATLALPPFDRSPIDGYAVHHLDLAGASEDSPVDLNVTQILFAGDIPVAPLARGEAARVTTGAVIPPGATCVAWQEHAVADGTAVRLHQTHGEGENISPRGSDIAAGQLLVEQGARITSGRMALLAGQGLRDVDVYACPKIGILATGSELSPSGIPLSLGKIYETNNAMLAERVRELGAIAEIAGDVPDDPTLLAAAVERCFERCDMVITTGGVSVGPRDHMEEVGIGIGAEKLFHGVHAKPGSPILAMKKDGKLLLCLSGNPFAAFANFELLAAPAIRRLAGESVVFQEAVECVLQNTFPKKSPRRRFVRAHMQGGRVTVPEGSHESGAIMALADCNCLLDIPAGTPELAPGTVVKAVAL